MAKSFSRAGKANRLGAKPSGVQTPKATFGAITRSQAVSTYGVGAIFEMRTFSGKKGALHSVMTSGLSSWVHGQKLPVIREIALEQILGVQSFRQPPSGDGSEGALPVVRFPRWLVCSKCDRMGRVPNEFEDRGAQGIICRDQGCKGKGIPGRLVVACFDAEPTTDRQPGHIDDFPWVWWAHSRPSRDICAQPVLKLVSNKKTAGLAGLEVRCYSEQCKGQGRSLDGVFGEKALDGSQCFGNRPWLGDHQAGCPRTIRALQRGASNVYFPLSASAISIPPNSDGLMTFLPVDCGMAIDEVRRTGLVDPRLLSMIRNSLRHEERYTDAEIGAALLVLAGHTEGAARLTEAEYRQRERTAIVAGRSSDDGGEFESSPLEPEDHPQELKGYFDTIVRVRRLREVRALYGFLRVNPRSVRPPDYQRYAPLSSSPTNWLPAIDVRGEGFYIELARDRVAEWSVRPSVVTQVSKLLLRVSPDQPSFLRTKQGLASFLLLHTFAHLLIRQVSLECGYSSASLRERLYFPEEAGHELHLGLLIYTASQSSDGTLGGLVRQAEPKRLGPMVLGALASAAWCSSDPLCIESTGQGVDAHNLAACHACALVSETSCEHFNTYLDRSLLVGRSGMSDLGYFEPLLSKL